MEWIAIFFLVGRLGFKCRSGFIHSIFCLTTCPKPPPKWFLHVVRSKASSFKWQYPLLSLRSSSSFLRLLPRLLVTFISSFVFPSITCFRRQFLRKMWPIDLAFCFLISFRIFLWSLTLSNTSSFLTWSVQLIFSILLQHNFSKLSSYSWISAVIIEDFRVSVISSGSIYFKHRNCRSLPYSLCLLPTNHSISRCYIIWYTHVVVR